jgi:hypothetical protein
MLRIFIRIQTSVQNFENIRLKLTHGLLFNCRLTGILAQIIQNFEEILKKWWKIEKQRSEIDYSIISKPWKQRTI